MSTPQITEELTGLTYNYRQPNLTYKLNETNIRGRVDGLAAIKQAVYHILRTERFSNPIYDADYGVELEQYIGRDFGFIAAGIQETLRDALLQDDRITDIMVDDISISTEDKNAVVVQFTVYTIYGQYKDELVINK